MFHTSMDARHNFKNISLLFIKKNYTLRVSMVDFLFLVIATWFNFLSVDEKNLV